MKMVRILPNRGLPRFTKTTNLVPFAAEQKRISSTEYSFNSALLPLYSIFSELSLTKFRLCFGIFIHMVHSWRSNGYHFKSKRHLQKYVYCWCRTILCSDPLYSLVALVEPGFRKIGAMFKSRKTVYPRCLSSWSLLGSILSKIILGYHNLL